MAPYFGIAIDKKANVEEAPFRLNGVEVVPNKIRPPNVLAVRI